MFEANNFLQNMLINLNIKQEGMINKGKKIFVMVTLILFIFFNTFAFGQPIKAEKYKKAITKGITYGREKDNLGLLSIKGLPRRGPESFSTDAEGNLYICDTVNRRVQVFSSNGNHIYEISLKEGMMANDIAIDRFGLIYIYDVQGKLYQYDKKGNLLSAIDVNTNRWHVRMAMHIVNDNIYISSVDQEDVIIGKVVNGLLVAPTKEELFQPLEKGIHGGFSGRRYFVNLVRWEKGEIEISQDGIIIKSIELPLRGIVSIAFLEEDRKGNFYIQTERTTDRRVNLEVHKFDSDGNYLSVIPIPETDYSTWGIKLLSVAENGDIYQFLPTKERGQLIIFKPE